MAACIMALRPQSVTRFGVIGWPAYWNRLTRSLTLAGWFGCAAVVQLARFCHPGQAFVGPSVSLQVLLGIVALASRWLQTRRP